MIFGLSTARVGATLAVVLVGYNIIIGETPGGEPIRLLNEDVLNGTVLMILITCTISSFLVEKTSQRLALIEENKSSTANEQEKILISLAYPETVNELVDLGLMLKPKSSSIPVFALNIVTDEAENGKSQVSGTKMMSKAVSHAAASGHVILPLTRFDINISNGIIYTIMEQKITDVVIGLHQHANASEFLGGTTEHILKRVPETVFIYKNTQPFNTLQRMLVVVSPKAELEPGYAHWFSKLCTIAREGGMAIEFYASSDTIIELKQQESLMKSLPKINYHEFIKWEDFLIFSRELKKNDLFVIVSSRKGHASYQSHLEKLPYYLTNYFTDNSYILLYPKQIEHGVRMDDIQHFDGRLAETISEKVTAVSKSGGFLKNVFGKK